MKDIRPLVKQNRTSLVLGSLILPNSGWLLANCAVPPTGRANLVLITVDTLRATSWPTATSVPPHLTPRWKYIHNPKRYSSAGAAPNGSGYFGFFRIAVDELYDLRSDPVNVSMLRASIPKSSPRCANPWSHGWRMARRRALRPRSRPRVAPSWRPWGISSSREDRDGGLLD